MDLRPNVVERDIVSAECFLALNLLNTTKVSR